MNKSSKRELVVVFEKLACLMGVGIPVVQVLDVTIEECADKGVAEALRDMRHLAVTLKEGTILDDQKNPFPKSVKMLWHAGEKAGHLADYCQTIAKVLRAEVQK